MNYHALDSRLFGNPANRFIEYKAVGMVTRCSPSKKVSNRRCSTG